MLLAVIAVASLHAQITDVGLFSNDSLSALRIATSGLPESVVVRRDNDLTRVSFRGTDLGAPFAGARRFQWLSEPGQPPKAHRPQAVWIERGRGEVTVTLRLPPHISVEPRQQALGVLLVFREPRAEAIAKTAAASPAPTPQPAATRAPEPPPEPPQPPPTRVASLTAPLLPAPPVPTSELRVKSPELTSPDLMAQLLATLSGSGAETASNATFARSTAGTEEMDTQTLYRRLFPHAPAPTAATPPPDEAREVRVDRTLKVGFLTFEPTLRLAYMDTSANLLNDTGTVRDRYFEIRPGLGVGTSLWRGRLRAEYEPALRAFGSFGATRSTTHRANASLSLAPGRRFQISVNDTLAAGVLEVQEVDPGGEYFFDLARFWRNAVGVSAHHEVAPRWAVEAGGHLNRVRFSDPGSFFDYDMQTFNLGIDHQITPTLHTSFAYVHERVPGNVERPQAESTANGVRMVVTGQATRRVSTQAMIGYRAQEHPLAGEGGREYRGLVVGGSVTRTVGLASSVTLSGTRSAMLSAFEDNGFYVTGKVQADLSVRLPFRLQLEGGVGHRWNDYRTDAREIGEPRDDTIFEWTLGLRRPFGAGSLGTSYQRQRRRSNIDRFDTSTDRLMLQLDFDILRATGVR